ncbi:MAG: RNA polymerase sigma factor [Fluviicola sp.]|jgi:RNA polymerase sigma factor (sigma-70 family)
MTQKEYNKAVEEFADNIYRFVLKHIKNKMLADDVVQETFAKVWEKHETVDAEKVKSYLFTTAYHCMVDVIKKESRSSSIDGYDKAAANNDAIQFDIKDILNKALDTLPEIQKTVIVLRDYEGYAYDEIAEITGLNESQVKVYIFRGRQTLKNYLKAIELVA